MRPPYPPYGLAAILVVFLAAAAFGAAQPAVPVTDNVQKSDCRIWSKRFDPFRIEWQIEAGAERSIRCVTRVADGDRGRKGAKVVLTAALIDAAGKVVSLGARTAKTDQGGVGVVEFPLAGVASAGSYTARVDGRYKTWTKATTMTTDCGPSAP